MRVGLSLAVNQYLCILGLMEPNLFLSAEGAALSVTRTNTAQISLKCK